VKVLPVVVTFRKRSKSFKEYQFLTVDNRQDNRLCHCSGVPVIVFIVTIVAATKPLNQQSKSTMESQPTSLSPVSYKSTHSSRSSVLERAREYNRRIEDQKHGLLGIQHSSGHYNSNNNNDRRRSKSLERGSLDPFGTNATGSVASGGNSMNHPGGSTISSQQYPQRSHSAGRAPQYYYNHNNEEGGDTGSANYSPTRHRAMASVSSNTKNNNTKKLQPPSATSASYNHNNTGYQSFGSTQPPAVSTTTKTPIKGNHTSTNNRESTQQQRHNSNNKNNTLTPTTATTATQSSGHHQSRGHGNSTSRTEHNNSRILIDEKKEESHMQAADQQQQQEALHGPVVTPELLVDALSGHEDGLLAIAEKLMEHYDSGYDVMGEAIIDAFADVQKLFQHGTAQITFLVVFGSILFVNVSSHHSSCISLIPHSNYKSGRSGTYGRCRI
jgi:hypothetical protein